MTTARAQKRWKLVVVGGCRAIGLSPTSSRGALRGCAMSHPPETPPLLAAVVKGDVATVERMRASGADMLVRAPRTENTALHLAAAEGRLDVLRALIPAYTASAFAARQNMNARNLNKDTPLMFACAKGQIAAAATLLKAGASVDLVNDGRMTPLILASAGGQRACVELILRANAPIEAEDEHGRRALHYAAASGALGCVEALLAAGADPFARNRAGATPADVASAEGATDAATFLRDEMRRREEAHAAAERELLRDEGGAQGGAQGGAKKGKKAKRAAATEPREASPAPEPKPEPKPEPEPEPELQLHAGWAQYFAAAETETKREAKDEDEAKPNADEARSNASAEPVAAPSSAEETSREPPGFGRRRGGDDASKETNAKTKTKTKTNARPSQGRVLSAGVAISAPKSPPKSSTLTTPSGPSWASVANGDRRARTAAVPSTVPSPAPPPPPPPPVAPEPAWVTEAHERLARVHPTAVALELEPRHVLGLGTSTLSYSQLEAAEEVHRELLSRLADARIELVREQERTRAEELAEIERLRRALADARAR